MIAAKTGVPGDSWQLSVECSSDSSSSGNLNLVDFRGGPNCRWKLSRGCCDHGTEGSCMTQWTRPTQEKAAGKIETMVKRIWLLHEFTYATSWKLLILHYQCLYVHVFCDPMDCIPPGSSGHGISPARILEWVVISSSRGSYWPRDQTHVFCIGRRILYHWATREVPRICLFFP